ncbi:hypothetical protein NKR23_g12273 [Pleurostoma richardsiae]|uniref:Uncharacterized protein n=1 Tax=Pleurostoma richardsiae TaxID=41990 RepID=A0AA38RGQ0_9PEZI|nr:hypothetical protein NKR23_g12273 [Pleurostoma richardsiae]
MNGMETRIMARQTNDPARHMDGTVAQPARRLEPRTAFATTVPIVSSPETLVANLGSAGADPQAVSPNSKIPTLGECSSAKTSGVSVYKASASVPSSAGEQHDRVGGSTEADGPKFRSEVGAVVRGDLTVSSDPISRAPDVISQKIQVAGSILREVLAELRQDEKASEAGQ